MRIVELMKLFAERENTIVEGSIHVVDANAAWRLRRLAIFTILEQLCSLIKERERKAFYCLYWAMKTFGQIAMDFKDLHMALKVFRRLKHEC